MNRELMIKTSTLLNAYREFTIDHRIANMCTETIEEIDKELAKPEQEPYMCHWVEKGKGHCERNKRMGFADDYGNPRTELAKPEQKPVAWNENVDEMPINTYCKAVVDWYSYSTDGDSFLEGRDVEVIVVKYKLNEDEDDIVFIHEGNNQYEYTRCDVLKWKPLYTSPPRKEWVGLTQDEIEEIYRGNTRDNGMCSGLSIALEVQLKLKEKNNAV